MTWKVGQVTKNIYVRLAQTYNYKIQKAKVWNKIELTQEVTRKKNKKNIWKEHLLEHEGKQKTGSQLTAKKD